MIVVLGAAIAAWVIFSGSDDASAQGAKHKAQGTIREVAPAAAPKARVVEEKKPVDLAATGKPWPDRESKLPADISRAIKGGNCKTLLS